MTEHVEFREGWIDGPQFELALGRGGNILLSSEMKVRFRFSSGAKLMVDAGVRLLSLANQLVHLGKNVTLEFSQDDYSTFDYLNRAAFFEHLHASIKVLPHRPIISTADIYRGGNRGLVEFAALAPDRQDKRIPNRLAEALTDSIKDGSRRKQIGNVAFTLFSELIGNVYAHSETPVSGFAVLQAYPKGNGIKIAVSDSGKSLLETLRPALKVHYPRFVGATDTALLIHTLKDGLSRNGRYHGCGLKICADHALKLGANLELRLPVTRFRLNAKRGTWQFASARIYDHCPLLWGTHIAFDFRLD
jgi:hypothetical protein